jgi:hypothetical protein
VGDTSESFELDGEETKRFFGDCHVLEGKMSIENCLKIFDEKQERVTQFMAMREMEDQS